MALKTEKLCLGTGSLYSHGGAHEGLPTSREENRMNRMRRADEPAQDGVPRPRFRRRPGSSFGAPRAAHRGRMTLGRRLTAGVLTLGLVGGVGTSLAVTSSFLAPASASAATHAVGYDRGNGWLGAYRHENGLLAYCLEILAGIPYSPTPGSSLNSDWNGLSADQIAKLNFMLSMHGNTEDANTAAAVALYVWDVADNANYNSHGMSGDAYYGARAGENYDAVIGLLNQYRAEAAGVTATQPGQTAGSASLALDLDKDAGTGTVTFRTDPGALSTSVHLSNAVFDDSESGDSRMTDGETKTFRVVPNSDSTYSVEAHSDEIKVQGASGYAGNITTWSPGKEGEQWTASPGQQIDNSFTIAAAAAASDPIPNLFSPIGSTQVSTQRVEAGQDATDTVTAGVTAGSGEWRKLGDGSYVPVIYKGTLYGPYGQQPAQSDAVPVGAPVVGSVELTAAGPRSYTSPGITVPTAGFYTWVWTVDEASQSQRVQTFLPDGYGWSDGFGLVPETNVSPGTVDAASLVQDKEIPVTGTSTDTLTVKDTGAWLKQDGKNVPVTFTGTAYWIPGTGEVPAAKPENATVLKTSSIVANGPGTYTADAVTAPASAAGHIVWMWSTPQTLFNSGWADVWNARDEVVKITTPDVHTNATPSVALTDTAKDEAIVDGEVPEGAVISFEAYRQSGDTASCTVDTRVYDGSTSPVTVTAGQNEKKSYWSSEVRFTEAGTYYWVETLRTKDGQVIHRGECGAPGESTKVTVPGVTTKAQTDVAVHDGATDDAIITGDTPQGAYLVWKAYQAPTTGTTTKGGHPMCDASTLTGDTTASPVVVNQAGTYTSPAVVFTTAGTVYWVEELHSYDKKILDQGECGTPGETTTVHMPDVHTNATPAVHVGDATKDEAVVNGHVPADAAITFEAYKKTGDQATCTASNRVYDGSSNPVVTTAGLNESVSYWSGETRFTDAGTYYWVETLATKDGQVIHRGECGAPGETTVVSAQPVTPTATVSTFLADTGSNPGPWIGGGITALILGLGIALFARKRRATAAADVTGDIQE